MTTASINTGVNSLSSAQEYTHAAYCLDLYLNNTAEIYNRFTVPAIELAAAGLQTKWMPNVIEHGKKMDEAINNALQAAARLVQKHGHMTPTPEDIKAVKADYVAYIIECAQYQVNNA